MKHNYRYLNYVGDSEFENRFGTAAEMKAQLTRMDISNAKGPDIAAAGAPFLSDTKIIYGDTQDYHTLILGSTGSMKTRTLILPTIFSLALAGENMLITDPKGELFEKSSGYLKSRGYLIDVINLREMKRSGSWNPLGEAWTLFHQGEREAGLNLAHEFVNALVSGMKDDKSPSWASAAKQLLDGLVELMLRGAKSIEECNPASFSTLIDRVKTANQEPSGNYDAVSFEDFVDRLPDGCSLKNNLANTVHMSHTATTTLAGILDVAYASINAFTASSSLMALTSRNSFDMHRLARPDEKHAIYLIVPDEDTTYHFIASNFIKQVYNCMVKESYRAYDGQLPRRLNYILDEFANFPKIPDMPAMITAARSRNMRFFLVVQSDNQLKSIYREDAETIKTNCLNWVYFSTKEDSLIQQVQRLCGDRGNGSNIPLISYRELSSLRKVVGPKGGAEAIILMHRTRPYLSFLPDISRYEQFENYPAIEPPVTDGEYIFFDLNKRALFLDPEEAEAIYAGNGILEKKPEEKEPEEEEEPTENKADWGTWDVPPASPAMPKSKQGSSGPSSLSELLKRLKETDDDE